jgi:hypothetical protein
MSGEALNTSEYTNFNNQIMKLKQNTNFGGEIEN